MKSIKEKAEEWAKEFTEPFIIYYTKEEVVQFEAQHEDSFKAGANYVLDEIEKVVQGDLSFHCTFKLKCIKQIVEELKK